MQGNYYEGASGFGIGGLGQPQIIGSAGQQGFTAEERAALLPASGTGARSDLLGKLLALGGTIAAPVLAYHGYKRNVSVGWALVWGLFGSAVWPITVPIAFAQGYGKKKVAANRRRRRTSRRSALRRRRRTSRRGR